MSHFTSVKGAIPVSEKETLVKALQSLGLNPEVADEGQTIKMDGHYVRTGYDTTNNNSAHIVLRCNDIKQAVGNGAGRMGSDTDLGFRESDNGTYEIVVDDYSLSGLGHHAFSIESGGKTHKLGLKAAISYAYVIEQARKLGGNVRMNGLEVAMQPAAEDSYLYESEAHTTRYVSI